MKKFIIAALLFSTGCGHNLTTYVDGYELNVCGVFVYRSGKILNANIRENTSVSVGNDSSASSESTSTSTSINFKTGKQVNGYHVDIEEKK